MSAPDDYAYLNASSDPGRPHLHDYWNGQTIRLVLDERVEAVGPGMAGGDAVVIHRFEPPSGHVVPQGTAFVDVVVDWQDATGDMYGAAELWVQSAADREPRLVAGLERGAPVRVASANEANDLPHQLLSAWAFEFRLSAPDPPAPFLRFKGSVEMLVTAERGLDIPIYPGHPDRWRGRSEIALLDVTHTLAYAHDPLDGGCDGVSCQTVHAPEDGTIVPPGTERIEAVLDVDVGATPVGLAAHGPEGRAFRALTPVSDTDGRRVYDIAVAGWWDGPYAQQSQWAFLVTIEGPVADGAAYETYHLVARALPGPEAT